LRPPNPAGTSWRHTRHPCRPPAPGALRPPPSPPFAAGCCRIYPHRLLSCGGMQQQHPLAAQRCARLADSPLPLLPRCRPVQGALLSLVVHPSYFPEQNPWTSQAASQHCAVSLRPPAFTEASAWRQGFHMGFTGTCAPGGRPSGGSASRSTCGHRGH